MIFFHIFPYFLLSVGVYIYPNVVGRTLGKTISYFSAFGFRLPSGDTARVPGTWAGLREEKTGQCFFPASRYTPGAVLGILPLSKEGAEKKKQTPDIKFI